MIVGQGWCGPTEFWSLPPAQVWWIIEDRMPQGAASGRTDRDAMLKMLREAKRRGKTS